MTARTLRFRFDFISPYAYLAWKAAPAFCEARELELSPEPLLFAGMLNHWGQLGPAEVPPKRDYTFRHCVRRAARQGVRFGLPPAHPFNPLTALRVCALDMPRTQRVGMVEAFFDATWGGAGAAAAHGVDTKQKVHAILESMGLPAADLLARAAAPEHKAKFLAANELAVSEGVFGVPTLSVDDELFWGSDVFEDIAARLRGEDPVDDPRWAGQTRPPEGVQRPRPV